MPVVQNEFGYGLLLQVICQSNFLHPVRNFLNKSLHNHLNLQLLCTGIVNFCILLQYRHIRCQNSQYLFSLISVLKFLSIILTLIIQLAHKWHLLCADASYNIVNCCACRVLLRVRLLYYLKQEVIGQQADKIFSGAPARYAICYQTLFVAGEVCSLSLIHI